MTTTWKCKSKLVEFNHAELIKAVDIVWTHNAEARKRFEVKEAFLNAIVEDAESEFPGDSWGRVSSFWGLFMCSNIGEYAEVAVEVALDTDFVADIVPRRLND
jgi:uncharacterized protein YggL (DUF469 family)